MNRGFFVRILSLVLSFVIMLGVSVPLLASAEETTTAPVIEEEVNIPDAIVEVARAQIGYYDSNINKFTTWYYGLDTSAYWCSIFVSWCADQVGALGTAVPKRASCLSMKNWFEKRGEYYPVDSDYIPQKGDIVFINTAVDGTDSIHHVDIITQSGFIKSGKTLKIKCIGGNTSDINYNGSEYVTEKTRPVDGPKAQVVGYAHPSYEESTGLAGSLYSIADNTMPAVLKFMYAKVLEMIFRVEMILDLMS